MLLKTVLIPKGQPKFPSPQVQSNESEIFVGMADEFDSIEDSKTPSTLNPTDPQQFFCGHITNVVDNNDDQTYSSATLDERVEGKSAVLSNYQSSSVSDDYQTTLRDNNLASNCEENNHNHPIYIQWFALCMKDLSDQELLYQATHENTNLNYERRLADSGATCHITNSDEEMSNVERVSINVMVGNGRQVKCTKRGDVLITNGAKQLQLKNVLYAPTFSKNIISIGLLCNKDSAVNSVVTWTSDGMTLKTLMGGQATQLQERWSSTLL